MNQHLSKDHFFSWISRIWNGLAGDLGVFVACYLSYFKAVLFWLLQTSSSRFLRSPLTLALFYLHAFPVNLLIICDDTLPVVFRQYCNFFLHFFSNLCLRFAVTGSRHWDVHAWQCTRVNLSTFVGSVTCHISQSWWN